MPHTGETRAIVLSAAAPALWSIAQFARSRRVDAISVMVLSGIALSLLALAVGGSPKMLLFRESLINGVLGVVLIGSVVAGRPLLYVLAIAAVRSPSVAVDGLFGSGLSRVRVHLESDAPAIRRAMTVLTLLAGCVFVAETVVRSVLVFTLPTERVLLLGPVFGYATIALLLLCTFAYIVLTRSRSQDDA